MKLKTWVTLSSLASSLTAKTICNSLGGLKSLYNSVEGLLQLPLSQQALVNHKHQKWVGEILDGWVRLLDICSTARDIMLHMKENVKDLESALRRKGGDLCLESEDTAYICSRKKTVKDIRKCIGAMKRTQGKYASTMLLDQDQHLLKVVTMLRDVMSITVSIFQATLSFMSVPRPKPKPSKWLLVSKMMHKGKVACAEDDPMDVNEVENVHVALSTLSRRTCSKGVDTQKVQKAHKRLEALEICIDNLDAEFECMFRCMIQTRVSILNMFTH